MKNSYGFSALFEAMEVNKRRMENEDVIMDFASGAMEASLLGDDVVSAMGVTNDGLPTGMEDYEDEVDDSDMDDSMKRLDAALDDSIESEDEVDVDEVSEATGLLEAMDFML